MWFGVASLALFLGDVLPTFGESVVNVLTYALYALLSFLAILAYRGISAKFGLERSEKIEGTIRKVVKAGVLAAEQYVESRWDHADKINKAIEKKKFATEGVRTALKRIGVVLTDNELETLVEAEVAMMNGLGDYLGKATAVVADKTTESE